MFCAENRQILAIVDWPLLGVDSLQRCPVQMTYKVMYEVYTRHLRIFEGCQHQSMANQQSRKSVDSLHKTCNGSTPERFFLRPHTKRKKAVWECEVNARQATILYIALD